MWGWTSNSNCFANNYLIEGRASKYYKNFIETIYGFNELTKTPLNFSELMDMPYNYKSGEDKKLTEADLLNIKQETSKANKQKKQLNEITMRK